MALLRRDGYGVVDLGSPATSTVTSRSGSADGVACCDAVLTSGGVSMGDFDLVKVVLDRIGKMHWMQVAIRPAKPFAFGLVGDTPVFGLPGNPVSSMVSYEVLARPGLRRMAGQVARQTSSGSRCQLSWRGRALRGAPDRTAFARVQVEMHDDGRYHVTSAGGQGSHQLYAMALAGGLAIIPPQGVAKAGEDVPVLLLTP